MAKKAKLTNGKKTNKRKEAASKKVVPNHEVDQINTRGKILRDAIDEYADGIGDGEMLCADGFEAAIIGVTESCEPIVVYDWDECVRVLRVRDDMTEEDAIEHMSFNVTGAYVGARTPIFIRFIDAK